MNETYLQIQILQKPPIPAASIFMIIQGSNVTEK